MSFQFMKLNQKLVFNVVVNTKNNLFQRKVLSVLSVVFIIVKKFSLSAYRITFRLLRPLGSDFFSFGHDSINLSTK